jgi:photosystem II stability/assembly factor-like uncharacterized protein
MRGDFSRVTFRPENHFSGVLLQQGRVQLDAEFNEHVDIEAYRDRATARDVIGPTGAPQDGEGFAIAVGSMLRGVGAGTDAWAVGEGGTLLRSTGGTAAWTLEVTPSKARLNAVDVRHAGGVAVGDGATILRLSGGTWAADTPPAKVTADLYGVYVDANNAWAVGAAGTVLFWDGTAWQRQAENADVTATLRDVHFAGDAGVAVGDDGTILTTTNRGTAWTAQTAPEGSGNLYSVAVVDAKQAWAVGAQGTVLSYDGKAWTAQPVTPRVTSALRAVAFTSAAEGSAVGDGGLALRLVNGKWQHEATGIDADLLALAALPSGALLAVGKDVAIARPAPGQAWGQGPALPTDGRTLTISAGDIYVEGVRCENEHTVSFDRQPEPPLEMAEFPPEAGTYGVFLHVQEQHLTAAEREQLREVALGGPDTATRTRTVWQAGLVKLSSSNPTCADVAVASPQDPPRGLLRARAVPAAVSTSECIVPPNGGYRRLENQLYRVEIHDGATYVWSRDNGSVIARLEGITTNTAQKTADATVSHTGRDATVGFGPEQIVEITDEGRMLRGEPGVLAQIDSIKGRTLVLSDVDAVPLTMADFPVNPIVRRWDGTGTVATGKWVELEDGVFVEFAEGPDPVAAFRTGDYWTIPARTLTGQVEWPLSGGVPRFEDRQGPRRHTAPLAIARVDANGVWSAVRDCRKRFPPLTDLMHMYYVGGDGQEVMPPLPLAQANLVALDRPLQVGVVNGGTPMAGAIVDFEVFTAAGAGKVAAPGGAAAEKAAIVTDAFGIATCEWQLDGATRTQVVEARFRDPLGQSPPQVVRFSGQLSAATTKTLARITRIFPLAGSGEDVLPGESVEIKVLVADECGPVEGAMVAFTRGDRGNGTIDQVQDTTTNGVASCRWTPDPETPTQDLTATLTGVPAPGVLLVPDITRFIANLNLAIDTAYSPPESCPEMAGIGTVQAAIDRLVHLLPRLYHVSGDGLEAPVGAIVELRAGIANRCGVDEPQVRFEQLRQGVWGELATVGPDAESIATLSYRVTEEARQLLRALLLAAEKPVGQPVYFTVSPAESGTDHRGGGSCVSIGEGGDFPTLGDALNAVGGQRDICLCLMAGDHAFSAVESSVPTEQRAHLSIHGCGRGARVALDGLWVLQDWASVRLADFDIVVPEDGWLMFNGVSDVEIEGMRIYGGTSAERMIRVYGFERLHVTGSVLQARAFDTLDGPRLITEGLDPLRQPWDINDEMLLRQALLKAALEAAALDSSTRSELATQLRDSISEVRDQISLGEEEAFTRLAFAIEVSEEAGASPILHELELALEAAVMARPGIALEIGGLRMFSHHPEGPVRGSVVIADNHILGIISFYGSCNRDQLVPEDVLKILDGVIGENLRLVGIGGDVHVRDNRFCRLALGEDMIALLDDLVNNRRSVTAIYESFHLTNNVIDGAVSETVARHTVLTSNHFRVSGLSFNQPPDGRHVAHVVSDTAIYTGNQGDAIPGTDADAGIRNVSGTSAEAANLQIQIV